MLSSTRRDRGGPSNKPDVLCGGKIAQHRHIRAEIYIHTASNIAMNKIYLLISTSLSRSLLIFSSVKLFIHA